MIDILVWTSIGLMVLVPLVGTLLGYEDLGALHTLVITVTILTLGVGGLVTKLV